MRNVKTGLAVFLCLVIYRLAGQDGSFLACTSAIICMQDSVEKSVSSGLSRLLGTVFGAVLGTLLYLIGHINIGFDTTILVATLGTMLMIVFCNAIKNPGAIVIGCVVLLVIVLQQTDQNPVAYGFFRLLDTAVGIFIAILINRFIQNPAGKTDGPPEEETVPPPELPADNTILKSQEGIE